MFKQLKNIDTAFRHIRTFSILFLLVCVGLCAFVVYQSFQIVITSQARVYILANGKAIDAIASNRKDNFVVEAKDHVANFHHFFFTLSPDDKAIQANIKKSLYLADETAKKQYDNLRESGYYASIISGNISQEIVIEKIDIDDNQRPIYFRCEAKQIITRSTSVVTRSLVTEGYLREVQRSENNSHGFLVEKWNTIENKDIKVENR